MTLSDTPHTSAAMAETTMHEPFFETFAADMDRHYVYREHISTLGKLKAMWLMQGQWSLTVYRFGRSLKTRPVPLLNPLLWAIFRTVEFYTRGLTGSHFDIDARIGPGFFVGHFGAIFVGAGVVIGRNSSIGQMCFVSAGGPEGQPGVPMCGERVYFGAGCKVIGGVHLGDGVAVGASAVVLEDVPENGVVVGNPATVMNYRGSGDVIRLRPGPGEDASGE